MLQDIINSISEACVSVADWFWDFLSDGFGTVGLAFVFGIIFFGLIYRFLISPALSQAGGVGNSLSSLTSGSGSDSVGSRERPHPNFSNYGE